MEHAKKESIELEANELVGGGSEKIEKTKTIKVMVNVLTDDGKVKTFSIAIRDNGQLLKYRKKRNAFDYLTQYIDKTDAHWLLKDAEGDEFIKYTIDINGRTLL